MKTYSIGEVSRMLHLSVSTLRYYDKEGLLDEVERSEGGIRIFKDADIRQLHMIECLKGTGMPLKDIKIFFEWCKLGDSTIENRYQMFLERRKELKRQMAQLQNRLEMIDYKCAYYKAALDAGTLNTPVLITLQKNAAKKSSYIKEIVGAD